MSKDSTMQINKTEREFTAAQNLPTIEMVSTGCNPRRVPAPRRIASLLAAIKKWDKFKMRFKSYIVGKRWGDNY